MLELLLIEEEPGIVEDSLAAGAVERTAIMQADLTIEDDVKRIVGDAEEQLGGLRFVINLASDYPRVPFDSLNAESWDRAMGTAKSSYLLAVHSARVLMKNSGPPRGRSSAGVLSRHLSSPTPTGWHLGQ